jgi:hypothetical protein
MDADDFAQHKLGLDRLPAVIFQSDDLGDPAFEVNRTFSVMAWLEWVSATRRCSPLLSSSQRHRRGYEISLAEFDPQWRRTSYAVVQSVLRDDGLEAGRFTMDG